MTDCLQISVELQIKMLVHVHLSVQQLVWQLAVTWKATWAWILILHSLESTYVCVTSSFMWKSWTYFVFSLQSGDIQEVNPFHITVSPLYCPLTLQIHVTNSFKMTVVVSSSICNHN